MDDLEDYESCLICNQAHQRDSMLQGENDEYFCKTCFKNELRGSPDVTPRKHRPNIKIYHADTSMKIIRMVPNPEIFAVKKKPQRLLALKSSICSLSKKPIQCPHSECNKYIGIFTFDSHFKYEHKEVPVIITHYEVRNSIKFYPQDVQFASKFCITRLNLSGENNDNYLSRTVSSSSSYVGKSNYTLLDGKPSFVALASRISAAQLNNDEEEENELLDEELSAAELSGYYYRDPGDKILVWLSSNIMVNNSYTIAASTLNNNIRYKYYGPILLLGDDPVKLCSQGRGLILTKYHYIKMTGNSQRPLELDIVVHTEE